MFFQDSKDQNENANRNSQLFLFLHTIHKRSLQSSYMDIILYSITLISMIFIELRSGAILQFTIPQWLALALLGLSLAILLLTLIGVIYRINFPHLKDLHKVFRYVLYPPIIVYSLGMLDQAEFLPAVGFAAVAVTLSIFLTLTSLYFLDEDFTDVKSVRPLGFTLTIFQLSVLLVSCLPFLHDISPIVKLAGSAYLCSKVQSDYNPNKIQIRFYKVITKLYALLYLVMLFERVARLQLPVIIAAVMVGLIAVIVSEYATYRRDQIVEFQFATGRLTAMEFTSYVRRVLGLLEDSRVSMKTQGKLSKPLISFLMQHEKYCKLSDCELKRKDTPIRSVSTSRTQTFKQSLTTQVNGNAIDLMLKPQKYDILRNMIFNEVQQMISRRKAAQPDNFDILTCSLHLSMVMNHKTACYELMRYAKSVTVEMRLQYYIFTLEKSLQSLERIEQKSVEGLKFDEIVMQFKKCVQGVLKKIIEFWQENQEDVISMQRVLNIARKINTAKQEVSKLWDKIAKLQTITTLHILRGYISLMNFMNERQQAYELQRDFRNMHSSIILSKTFKYIVGEDFCYKEEGVAVITVSRVSLGVIDYCNRYMASIFGYTQRDLNKARINILMPETINRVHDGFLQEFLENPGKQKQDCTSWELMGKQKNGYLFPIVMELKKSVVAGEIKFMAIINRRKKAINQLYFLTDQWFNVLDLTSRFDKMSLDNARKRQISQLFTQLSFQDLRSVSTRKNNTLNDLQLELRHKLYLAHAVISQLNFHGRICGYRFVFSLQPLNCRIKMVSGQEIACRPFSWRFNEQTFEGGDVFDREISTWSSERNKETLWKSLSERHFGEGVRVVRWWDGRFVRLDDWEYDVSDDESYVDEFTATEDLWGMSLRATIIKFIQTHLGKLLYLIVLAYAALMAYYLYSTLRTTWQNQTNVKRNLQSYYVKYRSSILLIQQLAEKKLGWSDVNLVNNTEEWVKKIEVSLGQTRLNDEEQYERLQKLLFLREEFDFKEMTNPGTLRFEQYPLELSENKPLYVLMALSIALGLIYYLNVKIFDHQLTTIMSIFLNLEQSTLKSMTYSCFQQMRKVQNLDQQDDSNLVSNHFEDENSIRKKRLRKIQSQGSYFVCDIIKVSVLLFTLIIYLSMVIYFQDAQEIRLQTMFSYSQQTFNMNKQGSELIINRLNELIFQNKFQQPGYRVDYLQYYQIQSGLAMTQVTHYLRSSICQQFPQSSCQTIASGVLLFGVNKAFNSFQQMFSSNSFSSVSQFLEYIKLFTFFISPIYNRIVDTAETRMFTQISSKFVYSLSLVCPLILVILMDAIVIGLELRKKKRDVGEITELVKLVPRGVIDEEVPVSKVRGYMRIRDGQLD